MKVRDVTTAFSGAKLTINGEHRLTWYEMSADSLTSASFAPKITVVEKYAPDIERLTTIELLAVPPPGDHQQ
jgi:hypothetical protein